MKLFFNSEKSLKNGLYLDYFFKNIVFVFYKSVVGNNFLYIIDKYIAEKIFFYFKVFFTNISLLVNTVKLLNFNQIVKLLLIIVVQILIIFCL